MQIEWQTFLGYYYLVQGKPGGMNKADTALKAGIHHSAEKSNASYLKQYYANLYNLWVQEQDEAVKAEYKKRLVAEYFKLVLVPDRKSTRLNSSHVRISYAVFCLKKKIKNI